ncbi:MAG TPA: HD domain-containing protein [Rectinemataceae bacterium]|nr:HD domain-containing protein [Rectinemataceae bacterium]
MFKKRSKGELQLADLLDHNRKAAVLGLARRLYRDAFQASRFSPIAHGFRLVRSVFEGRFPGYRPCSTDYHNHLHTLQVFSAAARLADGCILDGLALGSEDFEDILMAALLHDIGYIQEEGDTEGTGAKYTKTHVDRSVAFVLRHAGQLRIGTERAERIGRIILGTDIGRTWIGLHFEDDVERRAAAILASADLLGQMSDRAYLEKLLFLYYEFLEARIEGYGTAFDILRKTADFYESTQARLDGPLGEVSSRCRAHFARRHGIDRDLYREAIGRQMAYLNLVLADSSVNFRKKLKRLDLESIERARLTVK